MSAPSPFVKAPKGPVAARADCRRKLVLAVWLKRVATGLLPLLLSGMAIFASGSPALALNDAQQLVVESWRLVNQSYVDPQRFEAIQWKRLRQKTLERPIQTSSDAYDAIDALLAPIGDPYTRLLRPADWSALR